MLMTQQGRLFTMKALNQDFQEILIRIIRRYCLSRCDGVGLCHYEVSESDTLNIYYKCPDLKDILPI